MCLILPAGYEISRNRKRALLYLLMLSLIAAAPVNPIAKGGGDYLIENESSKIIQHETDEFEKAHKNKKAIWIILETLDRNNKAIGNFNRNNLFRALNIKSLGGVQIYPQKKLWPILDPLAKWAHAYNRYGTISYMLGDKDSELTIHPKGDDVISVVVNPDNVNFLATGVNFIAIENNGNDKLENFLNWQKRGQIFGGEATFYRRIGE